MTSNLLVGLVVILHLWQLKAYTKFKSWRNCDSETLDKFYYDRNGEYCSKSDNLSRPPQLRDHLLQVSKDHLLFLHNRFRNALAIGTIGCYGCARLPKAARMPKMEWNTTLEKVSRQLAHQCSNCKSSFNCKRSAKGDLYPPWDHEVKSMVAVNAGYYRYTGNKDRFPEFRLINLCFGMFINEASTATNKTITYYEEDKHNMRVQFANIALETNEQVGCAASYSFNHKYGDNQVCLVCSYRERPRTGRRLYTITNSRPAASCRKRSDESLFLCDYGEFTNQGTTTNPYTLGKAPHTTKMTTSSTTRSQDEKIAHSNTKKKSKRNKAKSN